MRVLTILSFVFLTAATAFGQQGSRVSGRLGNATAEVTSFTIQMTASGNGSVTTARTGTDGRFVFENVQPGSYVITGQMDCYRYEREVTVASGEIKDVVLDADSSGCGQTLIRESVTIAAGADEVAEQVSKTVDVISAQEMRDRADFSLVESLRTIPGFRVQQLGGFGRTASIKTRGLRNQDTAILLDGIRFRDASAINGDATPFLSDITLTSVSKVEVLRGSGSSLYGTNAVGGVVDFQTPEARSGTHGQISGAGGGLGLGRFRGNIGHGTEGGKFGITAGGSRTVYTKGIDGNDNAYNTNLQTRIDAKPFEKTTLSGRIFYSNAKVRLNSNPDTLGTLPATNVVIDADPGVNFTPDVDDPDDLQRSRAFSGQFVVNQIINNELVLSGYYQGLSTGRTNDMGPLGIGFQSAATSVFDGDIHTANAHLTWTPVTENVLTAGYEFEHEGFGNDGSTPDGFGDFYTRASQLSHTFYAQDLVTLLEGRLRFAGGLRVQRFSLADPAFSLINAPYSGVNLSDPPTAITVDGSASYFFRSTGTKLRAHAGNGYRIPSLYERFGTFFSTFVSPEFIALGDPFLKPEKSIAFDAGIEQYLSDDRVRLSSTYFYTHLSDIIGFGNVVPDIGSTPRPFGGYENQKGGIARGGEFSIKAMPGKSTDIFASYTYTNSDQRAAQVSGSGIISTLGIPDHQFTMVVTQRFGRFWVNFDLLATSDYLAPIFSNSTFNTYIYRFDGNRKGDLTAGYTFGVGSETMTLRLYGTVENVFDNEYYENGFRTAGVTGRIGATFGF